MITCTMESSKIADVNNPDRSEDEPLSSLPLSPSVISKLKDEGFTYVTDIKGLRPMELHAVTGINLKDCLAVVKAVRKDTDVQVLKALQMTQEGNHSSHISTFCKGLDNILGGGFATRSITELSGSPGIGKTQLCLQACISVQLPTNLGGLAGESVFIDTEGKFSVLKLKDIAARATQLVKTTTPPMLDENFELTVESLLKGIHYFRCYNCLEVLAAVRRVCSLQKESKKIKLLVIDSIAYPFLYDDYESELVGLKSFTTQELQDLVNNHDMAVIITNHLTIRGDGHCVDLVGELGEMWGHYPTVRLILYWKDSERVASVTKAPHLCNADAKYEVTVAGIEDKESIEVCSSHDIKKRRIEAATHS